MRNGLFMTWVQCPLAVAVKMAKLNKIRIGWTMARIKLLEAKVPQCFKCWKFGHTVGLCRSTIDRKRHCFRCGQEDHQVKNCSKDFCCLPCKDQGFGVSHRMGGNQCQACKEARLAPSLKMQESAAKI